MVAPDETTFAYIEGRPFVPRGKDFQKAVESWRSLATDPGAKYDDDGDAAGEELAPMVTWGTNPGMVTQVTESGAGPGFVQRSSGPRSR